jgi:hypothetical protein
MTRKTPYRTIDELKLIFRVADDRSIASAFGDNLKVVDGTLCVESKYLVSRFGFDPAEPFMTRKEVMDKMSVSLNDFSRLVRYGILPVFNLRSKRGSANLVLKRDFDNLNAIMIDYSNDISLFLEHNSKVIELMIRIFEHDANGAKKMVQDERDMYVLRKYFLENKSIKEIARTCTRSDETIRFRLKNCLSRFDELMDYIDTTNEEVSDLRAKNEKLQKDNAELLAKNHMLIETKGLAPFDMSDGAVSPLDLCTWLQSVTLKDLDISVRLYNSLAAAKQVSMSSDKNMTDEYASSLKWLLELNVDDLWKFRNFGKKSQIELIDYLDYIGCVQNKKRNFRITPLEVGAVVKDLNKFLEFYKPIEKYKRYA